MKRVAWATVALLGHVALGPACAAPTEMTVHITTNIACPIVVAQGISVAVGEASSIRDRIPALKTQRCEPAGDGSGLNEIGHVVLVPSRDKEAAIAIRVIAGIDVPESECTPDTHYRGCVIERLLLPFVPNENLHVEIRLAASCKDVPCDEVTTCATGRCVSAAVDSARCVEPAGCSSGTFEPPVANGGPPPTGGRITTAGGFRIHTFLASETFETFGPMRVDYLIVGGGGGGGSGDGGGGGAGGVLTGTTDIGGGSFSVVVGAGGSGAGLGEIGTLSKAGADSSFAGFTAIGGGRGGQEDHEDNTGIGGPANAGGNGGSGGGFGGADGSPPFPAGGSGTVLQGTAGGTRRGSAPSFYGMGGGGGAGGGGGNGGATNEGGAGGVGIASSISGAVVFYGGGGGGSGRAGNGGAGGNGGGGNGGLNASGSSATPNTGGGGGGGGDQATTGGSGGSGIVIVRYPL